MDSEMYKQFQTNELSHWWFVGRRKIIKGIIMDLNLERKSILELGSGTGGNIKMLQDLGDLTLGEYHDLAIELTEENYGIKPHKVILPDIDISQTFDLIVMFDVLEHIKDDRQTLKNLKKILNEGGSIMITVPSYQWLWSSHDVINHHFRRYSKTSFYELVKDEFDIKYNSYMNCFLAPLIIMVRWLEKLSLSKGGNLEKENVFSYRFNRLFKWVFSLESKYLPKWSFPFGISYVAVITPKNKDD